MNKEFQDLMQKVWEAGNQVAATVKANFQDELSRIEKELERMAEEDKKRYLKATTKATTKAVAVEAEAAKAADGFAMGRIEQLELIIKNQADDIDRLNTHKSELLAKLRDTSALQKEDLVKRLTVAEERCALQNVKMANMQNLIDQIGDIVTSLKRF